MIDKFNGSSNAIARICGIIGTSKDPHFCKGKRFYLMANRIVLNGVSYHGKGAISVIADEAKAHGVKKAFVCSDPDLIKFGVADQVIAVLKDANIPYEIFDEVKPNPTVKNVKAGIAAFQAAGADFMIAIGGGSSMDTSKAIGIIINNPEFSDVVSLEGVANTKKKSVPVIALPTTAGTAAEVTINYVITDEENVKKMVCVDPNDIPTLAIIDPELMLSMPRGLTASTGMDALTHAIEGLITLGAWEMSDMFETKAIEMIAKWLPKAVENPSDIETAWRRLSTSPAWHSRTSGWDWCTAWLTRWAPTTTFRTAWPTRCCCRS